MGPGYLLLVRRGCLPISRAFGGRSWADPLSCLASPGKMVAITNGLSEPAASRTPRDKHPRVRRVDERQFPQRQITGDCCVPSDTDLAPSSRKEAISLAEPNSGASDGC